MHRRFKVWGKNMGALLVSAETGASGGRTEGPHPGGWLLHVPQFGTPPPDGTLDRVINP